jgi:metacaspase-1
VRGVSLHIGLNRVDPNHYAGWNGSLIACENDARDMATIAQHQGFEATLLLTQQARATNVLDRLRAATEDLGAGDFFLITFAGHGAQVPDLNGDEADQLDETWVLYDRMLVDDELYAACSGFRAGVRVVIIADSCHSGTVLRGMVYQDLQNIPQLKSAYRDVVPQFRVMPQEALHSTYNLNKTFYEQLQQQTRAANSRDVVGDLILLSACQDNQLAADGAANGLFTGTLKNVWANGSFKGSYKTFVARDISQNAAYANPKLYSTGTESGRF